MLPAIFTELLQTMPLRDSTAISLVPPPISSTTMPPGRVISIPAPMAAATGSSIR